jgi:tetratricopeptide (TPR) repeat protein
MSEQSAEPGREKSLRAQHRAARRKRITLLIVFCLLLAVAIFAGKPVYHWVRAIRAEQIAAQGDALFRAGKNNEAGAKYRAALQLDPFGYRPLQSAALFSSHTSRAEAVDLWEQVVRLPQCTIADREEYAAALLQLGRMTLAEKTITELLKSNPDTRTLDLAARYSSKSGDEKKAIEFARIAANRAPEDDSARFELAQVLAASSDTAQRGEARKTLWALANKEGPYRQSAVEALARAPELPREEQERVIEALNHLPSLTVVNGLLAFDLKLQLHPESAEQIYDEASGRYARGEMSDLIELARWLNLRRQSERVLTLVPEDRALSNEQLLLARMDAMANTAHWEEIDALLSRPGLSLDPSVAESFRARTAQERGTSLDADVHWNHAIALAGVDPFKLRFIANFAEQSHAGDVAMRCYDLLSRIPGHAPFALHAMQRLTDLNGNTIAARSVAEKLANFAPDDPNARDQLAYLDLLLGRNVDNNFETAKKLAEQYPTRLSYRVTLALGYLRKDEAGAALKQFEGPPIEWERALPAWRAVYAAVLAANGKTEPAREMAVGIPVEKLNREERALIAPLTGGSAQ